MRIDVAATLIALAGTVGPSRAQAHGDAPAANTSPFAPAPAAPSSGVAEFSRGREVAATLLQVVAGYAGEAGGAFALAEARVAPLAVVAAPALAATAVCATGALASQHRGRCGRTFIGAYAGAALGLLVGVMVAPKPGPDDTQAFVSGIYGFAGMMLLAPAGAVLAYHIGSDGTSPEDGGARAPASLPIESAQAPALDRPGVRASEPRVAQLVVPVLHLQW